jgi:hypothetical protein
LPIPKKEDVVSHPVIARAAGTQLNLVTFWNIHTIFDLINLDINNDFYPTSSECSLPISIQSMPPALTKFICWLIDEKSFLVVSNQNQTNQI